MTPQARTTNSRRNWNRAIEGFDILHPVLDDFVVCSLKGHYGVGACCDRGMISIIVNDQRRCLRKHASDRERIEHDLDIDLVLRIIDAEQSQVFADKLPRICCSWVLDL